MCDTLVALAAATAGGHTLFAKNSDRERNEAQFLQMLPRQKHNAGAPLELTYITIPQVGETNAVLLSRPFWLWGAEMGANEHGVVIGNEAMQSVLPAARKRALIGMDLVRLGLERASTAAGAVEVITGLLEAHGQGGDCGHLGRHYYNNGFLIADRQEAYVLETVGRWWVVEKVADSRALSNAYSIQSGYSAISDDLQAHAAAEGWCDAAGRFDFADRLIDLARDAISFGRGRCARGTELLARAEGKVQGATMRAILRDHGAAAEQNPHWHPAETVGRTICMHAAEGVRRSQTTAAMVSELRDGPVLHWVTGTSAPCTSVFKPVLFGQALPAQGPRPSDKAEGASLWWRHEQLHRAGLRDFARCQEVMASERDALEAGFEQRMADALGRWEVGAPHMAAAITACWTEAEAAEQRWLATLRGQPRVAQAGGAFGQSWNRLAQAAGFVPA